MTRLRTRWGTGKAVGSAFRTAASAWSRREAASADRGRGGLATGTMTNQQAGIGVPAQQTALPGMTGPHATLSVRRRTDKTDSRVSPALSRVPYGRP